MGLEGFGPGGEAEVGSGYDAGYDAGMIMGMIMGIRPCLVACSCMEVPPTIEHEYRCLVVLESVIVLGF